MKPPMNNARWYGVAGLCVVVDILLMLLVAPGNPAPAKAAAPNNAMAVTTAQKAAMLANETLLLNPTLFTIYMPATLKDTTVVALPDLLPVTDQFGFCRIVQSGNTLKLIVSVKNQGSGTAGVSKTIVVFGAQPVIQDTPTIASNQTVALLFATPNNCFEPDCGFRITVDSANQVVETNEANNSADGFCLG